jgi:hypothetical protein
MKTKKKQKQKQKKKRRNTKDISDTKRDKIVLYNKKKKVVIISQG